MKKLLNTGVLSKDLLRRADQERRRALRRARRGLAEGEEEEAWASKDSDSDSDADGEERVLNQEVVDRVVRPVPERVLFPRSKRFQPPNPVDAAVMRRAKNPAPTVYTCVMVAQLRVLHGAARVTHVQPCPRAPLTPRVVPRRHSRHVRTRCVTVRRPNHSAVSVRTSKGTRCLAGVSVTKDPSKCSTSFASRAPRIQRPVLPAGASAPIQYSTAWSPKPARPEGGVLPKGPRRTIESFLPGRGRPNTAPLSYSVEFRRSTDIASRLQTTPIRCA